MLTEPTTHQAVCEEDTGHEEAHQLLIGYRDVTDPVAPQPLIGYGDVTGPVAQQSQQS